MIKYIGSKRLLLPQITAALSEFARSESVLDAFSGTSRVGQALKSTGRTVHANDHLSYAATIARCYVQADRRVSEAPARALIAELAATAPNAGYFTQAFCEDARYVQTHNGARIDAIRSEIEARDLPEPLRSIALTSLMEAADRVDSTTGVQMAYLKSWSKRSYNELELRVPALTDGAGYVTQLDAIEAASTTQTDVAYLDPPYNQHSYMGNYHMWETLVRWDAPDTYGVANKRVDCKEYSSDFNSKRRIETAMHKLVMAVRATRLLVSFSNEGYISRDRMVELLGERGHVGVIELDYKRYVGAQIGVYNPAGMKVGEASHLRNREYLFVVAPKEAEVRAVVDSFNVRTTTTGNLAETQVY